MIIKICGGRGNKWGWCYFEAKNVRCFPGDEELFSREKSPVNENCEWFASDSVESKDSKIVQIIFQDKNNETKTIVCGTTAYLLNDAGKTIDRIV